jgi:hypothetical protein
MLRIYLLLLTLAVSSCNMTSEQAAAYLRSEGRKEVACSSQVQGMAICMADSQQFRCVMTDYQGCGPRNDIACEKFYTERPAP